jgi:hypothetical protein
VPIRQPLDKLAWLARNLTLPLLIQILTSLRAPRPGCGEGHIVSICVQVWRHAKGRADFPSYATIGRSRACSNRRRNVGSGARHMVRYVSRKGEAGWMDPEWMKSIVREHEAQKCWPSANAALARPKPLTDAATSQLLHLEHGPLQLSRGPFVVAWSRRPNRSTRTMQGVAPNVAPD